MHGDEGVTEDGFELALVVTPLGTGEAIVTLFSRVSDEVTTGSLLAVSSASVGFEVGVEETTQVACLSELLHSIAADGGWGDAGSGQGSVVEGLNGSGTVGEAILGIGEGGILSV